MADLRHRRLAVILVLVVVVALWLWLLPPGLLTRSPAIDQPPVRLGADGGPQRADLPPPPVQRAPGPFTAAEARAFALLGQVADGVLSAVPPLDPATAAAVPAARQWLDLQPVHPGPRQATRTPAGRFRMKPRPNAPPESADAQPPDVVVPAPGVLETRGDTTAIAGPGCWAAVTLRAGESLRLVDVSGDTHALSIVGDAAGVRVDGGLVVPGRFYRISGTIAVTTDAPIGIHIRPLHAVPDWCEAPFTLPVGSG